MVDRKIIKLVNAKGLRINCFDALNEAVSMLQDMQARHKEIYHKSKDALVGIEEENWNLPINQNDTYKMENLVQNTIEEYAESIQCIIKRRFKNVPFDYQDYKNCLEELGSFDAQKVIEWYFIKYGVQEDLLALTQIQINVIHALPYRWREEPAWNPDNLPTWNKSKTSILFSTSSGSEIKAIVQFADILIGRVLPSVVEGWEGNQGDSLQDDEYGYCVYVYCNGTVRITFSKQGDYNRYKKAMFCEPADLLNSLFPTLGE